MLYFMSFLANENLTSYAMQQMRNHTIMLIILTLLYMKRNIEDPKISKYFLTAMLFLKFLLQFFIFTSLRVLSHKCSVQKQISLWALLHWLSK